MSTTTYDVPASGVLGDPMGPLGLFVLGTAGPLSITVPTTTGSVALFDEAYASVAVGDGLFTSVTVADSPYATVTLADEGI